jgi:KfrB protein
MKQRILVMNGQRLIQKEQEGKWLTEKVEKAPGIKPGIYNIFLSKDAANEETNIFFGMIFHSNKNSFYQKVGKDIIKHDKSLFDVKPALGKNITIEYQDKTTQLSKNSLKKMKKAAH